MAPYPKSVDPMALVTSIEVIDLGIRPPRFKSAMSAVQRMRELVT